MAQDQRDQLLKAFKARKPPRARKRIRPGTVDVPYADDPSTTYKVGTDPLYVSANDQAKMQGKGRYGSVPTAKAGGPLRSGAFVWERQRFGKKRTGFKKRGL